MSGDQNQPPGGERVFAALEACAAVWHWIAVVGTIAQPAILLAARIWLSQAIFVHQVMMMMHAKGFLEEPSVEATLIRGVAPLLLAAGLATRPVSLLLVLGVGQDMSATHLASPQAALLIWLVIGGAGPISLDFLLRGGLARAPAWVLRMGSRLYARGDALGAF